MVKNQRNKSALICIQEPLQKMADDVLEGIKERACDINWTDSTIENIAEEEIVAYAEEKWGKNIPYSLFEAIWDNLNWDEIESMRMEFTQLEQEWEKESNHMYWGYGMRNSDFY